MITSGSVGTVPVSGTPGVVMALRTAGLYYRNMWQQNTFLPLGPGACRVFKSMDKRYSRDLKKNTIP